MTPPSFDNTAAFISTCDESSHQLKLGIVPDWQFITYCNVGALFKSQQLLFTALSPLYPEELTCLSGDATTELWGCVPQLVQRNSLFIPNRGLREMLQIVL